MKTKNLFLVTIVMLFGVVVKSSGQTNNNTVVGINANAPGTNNVALGYRPLFSNVSGTNNIGIGSDAMYYLQNGHNNIAIGNGAYGGDYASLPNPVIYTNGSGNISFGLEALRFNFNGNGNIAMGSNSGWNSKGSSNIFIGNSSGSQSNVVSNPNDYNIAIGQGSGSVLNGSYNILMGYGAQNLAPYEHFYLNIGNAIFGKNILGKDSNFGDWNIGAPIRIGIGQNNPGNTLDIKSSNLGLSGLRFSNLNNTFNPTTSASKFLTVDGNGDVVLSNLSVSPSTSNGAYWGLMGNDITDANNFIGTTALSTFSDVVFKSFGLPGGRIGFYNTSFGYDVGQGGSYNIFMGRNAGSNNNSLGNVSIGEGSGRHLDQGAESNTFVGEGSGALNTTGTRNTFIGGGAGKTNVSGGYNTALGYGSLANNTTGQSNVAVSSGSLEINTSGSYNVAIGEWSLRKNNVGTENIGIGHSAGHNSTGNSNVFIGQASGDALMNGDKNTMIGFFAGHFLTSGSNNTFLGDSAGYGLTTGDNNLFLGNGSGAASGSDNVMIGRQNANNLNGINNSIIMSTQAGDERFRIVENGDMGIGTTTPGNKLEVKSNLLDTSGLRLKNLTSNSPAIANPLNKVLSVNSDGDVVLVNDAGTSNTGNFWGLNGNAGTAPSTALTVTSSPATSFLGTTDNQDLVFRRNNIRAGVLTNGTTQTAPLGTSLGVNSGMPNAGSVYVGNYTGSTIVGGTNNTFVGAGAGAVAPTYSGLSNNTFIGYRTGTDAKGNGNVYIGSSVGTGLIPTGEANTLRIHNGNSNPLISGNFVSRILRFDVNGTNVGNNVVEISSANGVFNPIGRSGLRFQDYTINSNPEVNSTNRFLTLNATGDVILMNLPTAASTDTDDQTLALTGNVLSISEGNSVTLPTYVDTDTDDQNLSISGNQLTISEGNTVTLPTDIDTDDQTLSITGNVLTISEGNNVTLPNTNIIPGNNVTITGNGTTATPFQISSNDTSLYANNGFINAFTTTGVNRVVNLNNRNIWFNSSTSPTNGRIYIGSNATYPTEKGDYRLYVEGGILTEKVRVAIPGSFYWADYVFANDYKLMPLNELDTYIKENKHLPGIESADELAKTGLDLGNMQAKQMEKIEELTLHLIDQNKTLESQAKEIEELKAQMKLLLEKK